MNQSAPRPADQVALGLAFVCQHLEYVRTTIADRAVSKRAVLVPDALARLADAASSADVAADLETVHRALRTADSKGIFEAARTVIHPVGIGQDDSEPVLRCPRRHHPCARYAQPDASSVHRCDLTGEPLTLGELRP